MTEPDPVKQGSDPSDKWVETLIPSVLPLFVEADLLRRVGTCVLLEVDGFPFAVTAGHVLDMANGLNLKTTMGRKEGQLVDLPYQEVYRSRAVQGHIDEDMGVIPLSRKGLTALDACVFLGPGETSEHHSADRTLSSYFVFGFPATNSQYRLRRYHVDQTAFRFTGDAAPSSVFEFPEYDQSLHFVVEFDHDDIRENGRKSNPPRLQGVSGGGIFHSSNQQQSPLTLVAIATLNPRGRRLIVGTRVEHFVDFARQVLRDYGQTARGRD